MKNPNKIIALTFITLLHFSKNDNKVYIKRPFLEIICCKDFDSPTIEYNKQLIRHCLTPSASFIKRFLSVKK